MSSLTLPHAVQVLIVGGGPAGASAAWHCAQRGLDVAVIDRAVFPRSKPCAEYVSPEGARILSAMGALELLEQHAAPLSGMVVHAPSGDRIHGEFLAQHGFRGFRDHGLGIRREILDATLLDRARAAGVRVFEGVKVEDVTRDGAGRVNGVAMRTDNGTSMMRAQLVIAADGLRSVVTRRLGLSHTARWPPRVALVAHFEGVQSVGSLGEMHVTSHGYIGLANVGEGVTNVALVVPVSQSSGMSGHAEAFLLRWIKAHPTLASRFANADRISPVRATGPFASRARAPWFSGGMLVGDAADFFDPFTGEGIYSALRGGELLAPFADEAIAANNSQHANDEHAALRAYERERQRVFGGKWRVERLIGTAVSSPAIMNVAARVLSTDRELSDLLIGVTGDFVPAGEVLKPRALVRMVTGLVKALVARSTTAKTVTAPMSGHVHRS